MLVNSPPPCVVCVHVQGVVPEACSQASISLKNMCDLCWLKIVRTGLELTYCTAVSLLV